MENELRKAIKLTLDKNKIEMPCAKTQLYNENIEKDDKK